MRFFIRIHANLCGLVPASLLSVRSGFVIACVELFFFFLPTDVVVCYLLFFSISKLSWKNRSLFVSRFLLCYFLNVFFRGEGGRD